MTGSVGYYSRSKCSGRTADRRVAAGLHLLRLPAATTDSSVSTKALAPGLGWHSGGSVKASRTMDDQRWIGWAVSTAYGQRYDVKSFTVTLTYSVLS